MRADKSARGKGNSRWRMLTLVNLKSGRWWTVEWSYFNFEFPPTNIQPHPKLVQSEWSFPAPYFCQMCLSTAAPR